jgi:hypothetical protein
MEDAVTLHAEKPGIDIRSDIAKQMPDMEAGARGVGEHVEHVEPIAAFQTDGAVSEGPRWIGNLERPPLGPKILPPRLNVAGELGGVAARGDRWVALRVFRHDGPLVVWSGDPRPATSC